MMPESFARCEPSQKRASAGFTVRAATSGDVPACVALAVAIGLGEPEAWTDTLEQTVRDGVNRALFVAEADGAVVGYGRTVRADASADPVGWYLLGVAVSPQCRRRGIGEALTRVRMSWVAERDDQVFYFTHRDNLASLALHERLGFVELARPFVPPGGTPDFAATQKLYVARLIPPTGSVLPQ